MNDAKHSTPDAAEAAYRLLLDFAFKLENETERAHVRSCIDTMIDAMRGLQARDKARTVTVRVPDVTEATCRSLLEIGFDVGAAAVAETAKNRANVEPAHVIALTVNPFRRESTSQSSAIARYAWTGR